MAFEKILSVAILGVVLGASVASEARSEPERTRSHELHEYELRRPATTTTHAIEGTRIGFRNCDKCAMNWYRFTEETRLQGLTAEQLVKRTGSFKQPLFVEVDPVTGTVKYIIFL